MASVWEIGADLISGGMYSLAVNVCNGSNGLKGVSDQVAKGVQELTSKTVTLMGDVDSLVVETEKLINYPRVIPRTVDELLPQEKAYYSDLVAAATNLEAQVRAQKGSTDDFSLVNYYFTCQFPGLMGLTAQQKELGRLAKELIEVRGTQRTILYNEPGDIPVTLHELQDTMKSVQKLGYYPRMLSRGVADFTPAEKAYYDLLMMRINDAYKIFSGHKVKADTEEDLLLLINKGRNTNATADDKFWAKEAQYYMDLMHEREDMLKTVPGLIPQTLTGVQSVLTKFNKDEQPRLDLVLDSVNGTLTDTRKVIDRFHAEEQPRIEAILTSVNDRMTETKRVLRDVDETVIEARETLADVDRSVKTVRGTLDFLEKYRMPILAGCVVMVGLWFLISLLILAGLVRFVFGL